jgi:hypothetical protein
VVNKPEKRHKDLKSLLGLERIMNKKQENMEKMITLLLLAYAVGLLTGEALREEIYSGGKAEALFSLSC